VLFPDNGERGHVNSRDIPNRHHKQELQRHPNGVQATPPNPSSPDQTPPEAPQLKHIESMFTRMKGMMERMMERMFAQVTQLVASILNRKSCN